MLSNSTACGAATLTSDEASAADTASLVHFSAVRSASWRAFSSTVAGAQTIGHGMQRSAGACVRLVPLRPLYAQVLSNLAHGCVRLELFRQRVVG